MPKTQFGKGLEELSPTAFNEMKSDLGKLDKVPSNVLRTLISRIARTYPCSNMYEVASMLAQEHGISDPQDIFDAASATTFIWENSEDEPVQAVVDDLKSAGLLSDGIAPILSDKLQVAAPLRELSKVASRYLRIGSPLFVTIRGTVDVRCRFHRTDEEFRTGKYPTELLDTQQVVLANMTINNPDLEEKCVSFLMDESDLRTMKRFVQNMERELELTKHFTKKTE